MLPLYSISGCFRYFKDTKLKANHNRKELQIGSLWVVSDISKILN